MKSNEAEGATISLAGLDARTADVAKPSVSLHGVSSREGMTWVVFIDVGGADVGTGVRPGVNRLSKP